MSRALKLCLLLLVLSVVACVPLDEPGGLLEPAVDAVKSQSTLDTGPIGISESRRAELGQEDGASESPAEPLAPNPPMGSESTTEAESLSAPTTLPEADPVADPVVEPETRVDPEPATESLASSEESKDLSEVAPVVAVESEVRAEERLSEAPVETDGLVDSAEADSAEGSDSGDTSEAAVESELVLEVKSGGTQDEPAPAATAAIVAADVSTAQELLTSAPSSDVEALAALDRVPRREPPPAGRTAFSSGDSGDRCGDSVVPTRSPLSQLKMTKWGSQSGQPYALLATPEGIEFRVDIGDRVGPHGGLVVEIDTAKVTVFELRLDADEQAQTVHEVIKARP